MEKKIGRKKCVYKRIIFCFLSAFFDVDLGSIYFLVIYFRVSRIFLTPLFVQTYQINTHQNWKNILWGWVEGAACASENELWHLSYSKPSQRLWLTAEERGDVLFWILKNISYFTLYHFITYTTYYILYLLNYDTCRILNLARGCAWQWKKEEMCYFGILNCIIYIILHHIILYIISYTIYILHYSLYKILYILNYD